MPLGHTIEACMLRLRSWRPFDKSFGSINRRRFARKRRRRRGGSRSIPRRRCLSANGSCSDLRMAARSTDSSGELFHWASDASEKNLRREKEGNYGGEREFVISGYGLLGGCDVQVNESGYGSEPGYKGDVELEYGDELDVDFFWGEECGGNPSQSEILHSSLQKSHHQCRHKKHDLRLADTVG